MPINTTKWAIFIKTSGYFSSVIRLVSVYPLPLTMRYRYMPLAIPAPRVLVPVSHGACWILSISVFVFRPMTCYAMAITVSAGLHAVRRLSSVCTIGEHCGQLVLGIRQQAIYCRISGFHQGRCVQIPFIRYFTRTVFLYTENRG